MCPTFLARLFLFFVRVSQAALQENLPQRCMRKLWQQWQNKNFMPCKLLRSEALRGQHERDEGPKGQYEKKQLLSFKWSLA